MLSVKKNKVKILLTTQKQNLIIYQGPKTFKSYYVNKYACRFSFFINLL